MLRFITSNRQMQHGARPGWLPPIRRGAPGYARISEIGFVSLPGATFEVVEHPSSRARAARRAVTAKTKGGEHVV